MASGLEWYQAMKEQRRLDQESETTIGMSFPLPLDIHRRLRIAAAEVGLSIREFITVLLDDQLPGFEEEG
jgi:hypothetical protein